MENKHHTSKDNSFNMPLFNGHNQLSENKYGPHTKTKEKHIKGHIPDLVHEFLYEESV